MKENSVETQYVPDDAYDGDDTVALNRIEQLKEGLDDNAMYGSPRYMDDTQPSDDMMVAEESQRVSTSQAIDCVANPGACGKNEVCIAFRSSGMGICHCREEYIRNSYGNCVADMKNPVEDKYTILKKLQPNINAALAQRMENGRSETDDSLPGHLSVSVVPKTVQLPDNQASLSAFPVPDEQTSGVAYNYSWTLIGQPKGAINGTMSDKTQKEIQMTNLSEGVYQFKVVVSGRRWEGEAFANVTVVPLKRVNKAPIVVINPATQIIKEPTSTAILDGSASTVILVHRNNVFLTND